MPFWVVPFVLFKQSFFQYPLHVQLSLIFCLSLGWYLVHITHVIMFTGVFLSKPEKTYCNLEELITLSGICFISIYILIGYYYSFSITSFLLLSFCSMICILMIYTILAVIQFIMAK